MSLFDSLNAIKKKAAAIGSTAFGVLTKPLGVSVAQKVATPIAKSIISNPPSLTVKMPPLISSVKTPPPTQAPLVSSLNRNAANLIKGTTKAIAPESYKRVADASKSGSTGRQILAGAQLAPGIVQEALLQPAVRTGTQLVRSVITGGKDKGFQPTGPVSQFFLGKNRLQSMPDELKEYPELGYKLAQNLPQVRDLPKNDPRRIGASVLGVGLGGAFAGWLKALDVEPGAGAPKKLLKEGVEKLAKEGAEKLVKESAENAVTQIGKHGSFEDFVSKYGVQRIEEPNVPTSFDKPQGLYTTPSNVKSPHTDLGGAKSDFVINPNAKEVVVDTSGIALKPRGIDQMATNLVWLRQNLPEAASLIRDKQMPELKKMFSSEFPDTDWSRYSEIQDMIEGYAGLKARQQGIDIIRGIDKSDPSFSEVVILNKDKVLPLDEAKKLWDSSQSKSSLPESRTLEGIEQATKTPTREASILESAPVRESTDASSRTPNPEQPLPESAPSQVDSSQKTVPYLNIDRLNIPPQAKETVKSEISKLAETSEKVLGKKLSFDEIKKEAAQTSDLWERVIGREQTLKDEALTLNLRQKMSDILTKSQGKVTDEFVDLFKQWKSVSADRARQLGSYRIDADAREFGPIDRLLSILMKQTDEADKVLEAAKKVDFTNQKQVEEFIRSFVKPKVSDWVDLIRYNSMLSSPLTHAVNISSNFQGSALLAPIEKTLTGTLDALRVALTPGTAKRQHLIGEGPAYLKGYVQSVGRASKNFSDVMRGIRPIENLDIRNVPLVMKSKVGRAVEEVLRVPTKLLEAMDQFFVTLTKGGTESALTYKSKKGLSVGNISEKALEEAQYRTFREAPKAGRQGYMLNAVDELTGLINRARNSENPIVSTMARFTVPFINTPMNIFKQGIEYSPLGLATLPGASNKTEQLSKIILGSAAALGVSQLVGADRLTYGEPRDQNKKNEFRDAGMQPYSVKIGNKWFSYQKLHPALAFNFALVSALDNAQKEKKLGDDDVDIILSTFAKHAQFMADQSYVKSIGDLVGTTQGDKERMVQFFSNYPQQLIPFRALQGWITRIVDPVQRRADPEGKRLDKFMQTIMAQIPGLSSKVPARTNAKGEEIRYPNPLINALSPIKVSTENAAASQEMKIKSEIAGKAKERLSKRDMAKEAFKSTFDKIQSLADSGKTAEAKKLLDGLNEEEYSLYKSLKSSKRAKELPVKEAAFYSTYQSIRSLVDSNEIEEAKKLLDTLSDEEYKLYKSMKTKLGDK